VTLRKRKDAFFGRLRTCRKTGYELNECQAYSSEIRQDDREKEKVGEVGEIYGTEQFNKR